ncbi:MAG: T9SS type A sorting domain-containing protein [Bacteroidota bacterium]
MRKVLVCVLLLYTSIAFGQWSITGTTTQTIDFSTTISGVINGVYSASGFQPIPSSGQLDSDAWAVTGFDSGDLFFGGTVTSGDLARGNVSTSVTTGGIYSYTGSPQSSSDPALMLQPGSTDFTSGTITLKIVNNTGSTITQVTVEYDLYVRNDQGKSNLFNFSYSTDNSTYTSISSLDYSSTEIADGSPTWSLVETSPSRSTTIANLDIRDGSEFYIRWTGNEVSGSGSMDEFGLDDISVAATIAPVIDSFGDNNYSSNPAWSGSADWEIVTSSDVSSGPTNSNTLRLNATIAGTSYLSTQRTSSWGTEQSWGFWIGRRGVAATASNQSVIWLWANESDLTSGTIDGYRIRFGDDGGGDEIYLERVDNNVATVILTSSSSVTNALTDIGFLVRVTRNSSNSWSLYSSTLPTSSSSGAVATDQPNSTNTNVSLGTVTDNTYSDFSNGYFGFMAIYTASGINDAEFDQFYFDTSASSPLPVELTSFTATANGNLVTLNWSTATEVNNYGFNVERAAVKTGYDPSLLWETICFVQGHGNCHSSKEYSFTDSPTGGKEFYYRLKQIDFDGSYQYSEVVSVCMENIYQLKLEQNYPNPFNPHTTIKYTIPSPPLNPLLTKGRNKGGVVTLKVYNILGELVTTLVNGQLDAGIYEVEFNGSNLTSGIYYLVLQSNDLIDVKKCLLIK